METPPTQPTIADYLRPLVSRKWLILVAVVVATVGVYGYYARKPDVYTAGSLVFVKDPGDPVSGVPSLQSTDRSVQNQAVLLYSRRIASTVRKKIDFAGTSAELLDRVSVTSRAGEDFVDVAARGRTATEAAAIANAYGQQLARLVNTAQASRVGRALTLSRQQLARTSKGPAGTTARQALADQISRLELVQKVPPTVARQIDRALPPAAPSEPKPMRNALFAFVISLLLAVGVAFGMERFDRRLKRPDEVESVYGSPLLAVIPHSGDPAPTVRGTAALGDDFREAFRVLRTNIELASIDEPARTIVVSSAVPGEGKSTVVRNLALAFRETGKSVAVVEADLRRPSLATLFGMPIVRGLTDVLRSGASPSEACVEVGAAVPGFDELVRLNAESSVSSNGANGNGRHHAGTITLLLSGRLPANPQAVLASDRIKEVLDDLRDRHDIVLIDSAPLLAVADTVPLLRYADAAVFVGRLGVTTRDTAKRLVDFLARVPDVNLLGIVANDLSRSDAASYGYGYGYGDSPDGGRRTPAANGSGKTKQPV